MRLPKLKVHALAIGVITLCAGTYLIALAGPKDTDGALKTALVGTALFGQWLLAGMLAGYLARTGGWWHGLLVASAACPLTAALWVVTQWGWFLFPLLFYWYTLQGFLIVGIPLTTLGGLLGSFIYSRSHVASVQVA